ncbi:MAG: cytochrome c oxidase assembly protein [Gemmatimonadota bacterium]|nr:MAG: cytochrome c oxidase assembly protein [Gemmatimonadota bacterium]
MRLWCTSSQGVAWDWTWQPYVGVWLFILLIAVAYWLHLRRFEPSAWEDCTQRRRHIVFFALGLFLLWLALDWPIAPLGMGYLASVHMVQYMLIALIAPPLLLLGFPAASYEKLSDRPRALATLRNTTQPLVAFLIFNVIITVTHWPALVDPFMSSQLGTFALDMAWLVAGLVFWWPLIAAVPAWPRFLPLFQLAYLGLNGIIIRPPFFILLFSKYPAYATYELAPPIPGTSALSDQQLAAGIMKLGTAAVMVVAMVFVFGEWVRSSKRSDA